MTSILLFFCWFMPMAIMMMFMVIMMIMVLVVLAMPVLFPGHGYIQLGTAHQQGSVWPARLFVFHGSIRRISSFSQHIDALYRQSGTRLVSMLLGRAGHHIHHLSGSHYSGTCWQLKHSSPKLLILTVLCLLFNPFFRDKFSNYHITLK